MSAAAITRARPARGTAGPPPDLLIVDDHPIVLQGLRNIAEDAGIARVYEAQDIVGAYRLFHRHRPALVVTDIGFRDEGLSGLSLIRRIRALEPAARILTFSMHDDPVIAARALESGALGFVLKDTGAAVFLDAIEAVGQGRSYLPHDIATGIAVLYAGNHPSRLAQLDARELQILSLLGNGRTYREIAEIMTLNYRSVVGAAFIIRRKLGVETLADLIRISTS